MGQMPMERSRKEQDCVIWGGFASCGGVIYIYVYCALAEAVR